MEHIGISKEKEEMTQIKDTPQEERSELDMDFQTALQGMANMLGKAQRTQRENMELRKQNALLQKRVEKLENDELAQVVNLETIVKYAYSQKNPKVVRIIANMLARICFDMGCSLEVVRVKVRELEDYAARLEAPQPVSQTNHGCQQFYAPVTESEFHS